MKKLLSFVILIILVSAFCVFASADGTLPSVVDDAGLLTPSEEYSLESKIEAMREKYNFDVVIVTVPTLGSKTPMDFADDYYDYNGYGCGENNDGCLMLINIGERDLYISTTGYGEYAFTEFGVDYILDRIVDAGLSDGRYYDASVAFLDYTNDYLKRAAEGKPFDEDSIPTDWPHVLTVSGIIALLAGLIVSSIYISSLKSQLKSVAPKLYADGYIDRSSLNLTVNKDTFLYSSVSKTLRPQNTSGTRSGGGHYGSSGTHHGGGGRKF